MPSLSLGIGTSTWYVFVIVRLFDYAHFAKVAARNWRIVGHSKRRTPCSPFSAQFPEAPVRNMLAHLEVILTPL